MATRLITTTKIKSVKQYRPIIRTDKLLDGTPNPVYGPPVWRLVTEGPNPVAMECDGSQFTESEGLKLCGRSARVVLEIDGE